MVIGRVPDHELAELRTRFEATAALLVGDRFVDFDRYPDANYGSPRESRVAGAQPHAHRGVSGG